MVAIAEIPVARLEWRGAVRIIRSIHPPIDLFEDIADPADWPLLISAEQKTNPRLIEAIGNLDLVPPERRASGPGSSYLMAPFTHVSLDRPSRFSDGRFGILYAGNVFEVALAETMHHHARFMAATAEPPGWTSQFREIVLGIAADLHDLRGDPGAYADVLSPDSYGVSQALGAHLRETGADGIVYPSVRAEGGECAAVFYPDLAHDAVQGRHLDYHWNGERIDYYRDASDGQVYRVL